MGRQNQSDISIRIIQSSHLSPPKGGEKWLDTTNDFCQSTMFDEENTIDSDVISDGVGEVDGIDEVNVSSKLTSDKVLQEKIKRMNCVKRKRRKKLRALLNVSRNQSLNQNGFLTKSNRSTKYYQNNLTSKKQFYEDFRLLCKEGCSKVVLSKEEMILKKRQKSEKKS